MHRVVAAAFFAIAFASGAAGVPLQRGRGEPARKDDRAVQLEEARHAIEARLTQGALRDVNVTAEDLRRVRRIVISVAPLNKNPRDDASTALTMAWQPVLQRATAFDEIAVRVGPSYSVTCPRRAFQDTSISLWREGLARTCREVKR